MNGALLVGHLHHIHPMRLKRTDLTAVRCEELTPDGFSFTVFFTALATTKENHTFQLCQLMLKSVTFRALAVSISWIWNKLSSKLWYSGFVRDYIMRHFVYCLTMMRQKMWLKRQCWSIIIKDGNNNVHDRTDNRSFKNNPLEDLESLKNSKNIEHLSDDSLLNYITSQSHAGKTNSQIVTDLMKKGVKIEDVRHIRDLLQNKK